MHATAPLDAPDARELPEITVVVSVFNKADTTQGCIASLLALDYPRWRMLIVEGGSTDGSADILKRFGSRITVAEIPGSLAVSLNRAFDMIETPLIALTDADCTVDRDWLRELARGFTDEGIVATAGYVGTGDDLPLLATLIGIEFQERYRYFPEFIPRSPTMNLCLRTEAARRVRFDERIPVAIETDFGYRLTRLGKMRYVPRAIVYHHPRTTWGGFFRQQVGFARGAVLVYLKHKERLSGDHISTFGMICQIPIFGLICLCLALGALHGLFLGAAATLTVVLLAVYARDLIRLPIPARHYPMMLGIFAVRTVGWTVGTVRGLLAVAAGVLRRHGEAGMP